MRHVVIVEIMEDLSQTIALQKMSTSAGFEYFTVAP